MLILIFISTILEMNKGGPMEYIRRQSYLDEILKFIDKPIIKILTGMRRVGKSTILKMINEDILKDIPSEDKIYINFENLDFLSIRSSISFAEYLKPFLQTNHKLYFFFDEIQVVSHWEEVVNGLQADYHCDIYITGSNSSMLSGNLSTLLAGRYVNFTILPFTFSEFIECYKNLSLSKQEYFQKFITLGGIPAVRHLELDENPTLKYLEDIYNTVLVKDVLEYHKIRDIDIYNRILLYACENIGHTFSALSIRNYLKSEGRNVSVDSILNYLNYCQDAYIIKKVPRYDFLGKKILKVEEKYFLNDHGFRQAKGFSNSKDIERVLENIVYVELLKRGYSVYIGKVNDKEIDFIASKNGEYAYYQVCYLLANEVTRQREFDVYHNINDNYPKYVLSMDDIDFSQNGYIHKNIIQWLLEK